MRGQKEPVVVVVAVVVAVVDDDVAASVVVGIVVDVASGVVASHLGTESFCTMIDFSSFR